MRWSEKSIGHAISKQLFQNSALVMVPNCNWTGHECDMLVVESGLRVIDIEIKISRADLRADAKKEKWWHREFTGYALGVKRFDANGRLLSISREAEHISTPRPHPPKAWKHYYALPAEIWKPELLEALPSASSGVLLLDRAGYPRPSGQLMRVNCIRRAKPNRDAEKLQPAQVLDIARLASLRMWEAYHKLEQQTQGEPA